jgi:shikimate 5-dehydrogenase
VYGLVKEKAQVVVYDRTASKAVALAKELGAMKGLDLTELVDCEPYDIIINATSVGYGTDETVAPASVFACGVVAMDVVFSPEQTTFLKDAKYAGAVVIGGARMLLHQALFQMELFTGKPAPKKAMEKALTKALREAV